MLKWSIKEIELPLKFSWNISRNSSISKTNFIIQVKNGSFEANGEVAFNVRYGESKELILEKFNEFQELAKNTEFNGVESLIAFMDQLELPQSLKFGIESSFVHYLAKLSGKTVAQLLGVNTAHSGKTSFSIPIMEMAKVESFIVENKLERFHFLKIKVNKENATDFTNLVLKNSKVPLRIDANEAFEGTSEVLKFIDSISQKSRIEFLEQPLPASFHEEALELKKHCPLTLIADESVTKESIDEYFKERFDGVNIKLMKSGGYFKAVKQIRQAKMLGLKTMLGCMVETSLGISSALNISAGIDYLDLDGFLLLKDEPFHLLQEENGKVFFPFVQ